VHIVRTALLADQAHDAERRQVSASAVAWGWQWHQLDHVQTICTSLQTDNHTNTSSLNVYRPDALPDAQPTVSVSLFLLCLIYANRLFTCLPQCRMLVNSGLSNIRKNITRNSRACPMLTGSISCRHRPTLAVVTPVGC